MKKIIAIAALAAASISTANATQAPSTATSVNTPGAAAGTSFVFDAKQPSVAPVFSTSLVDGINYSAAPNGTVLASTRFTSFGYTDYKVDASYQGANASSLSAAFSDGSHDATNNDVAIQGVAASAETVRIDLLKEGSISTGATTVTYTVTGYSA